MHLETLYSIAEEEQVYVHQALLESRICGIYRRSPRGAIIILNKKITSRKKLGCVLAEELGHHFTSTYNLFNHHSYLDKIRISREERLALSWAANTLIPDQDFVDMLRREHHPTRYEVAEHFYVTEIIVEVKFKNLCLKFPGMKEGLF